MLQFKAKYKLFYHYKLTMQHQKSPLSDSYIESEQSQQKVHYKIWLSREPKHLDIYLTHRGSSLVIGSKQGDQKQDIWLKVHDLIGHQLEDIDDDWKKLTLNLFAKKKKFMRKIKRYLTHFHLYINTNEYTNSQIKQLQCHLLTLATNQQHKSPNPEKTFMIYFNPCSGSNSKKHFDRVIDFLRYSSCRFDVLRTERRDHCKEHIDKELDFKKYNGVVIISGDGLMHEFVNSKATGVIPVTHVPAGSGNAFAKYQTILADEACEDQQAIFLALKGKTKALNLAQFTLEKIPTPIYSFLSFEWCFMADIDMNSEFLRFLGGLRFELYGLWRLLKVRKYKGKFTYSTNSTHIPPLQKEIPQNQPHFRTEQKVYLHQLISIIPWISTSYEVSPLLQLEDQAFDLQSISQEAGRWQLIKYMLNCQSGTQFDKQKQNVKQGYQFDWKKIKSFRLQPNGQDLGVFGIDGQKYQSQKIQAKISDKKVLTFA